jgi:glycosyltransferase involved in cell wall biosynthesis
VSAVPKYSVIIPVYNRPDEVAELLESLTHQTFKDFEVLIIEDGSVTRCEEIALSYTSKLHIRYFYKTNEGPGPSRNFGYQNAKGEYFVVFDSDCIIPPGYFDAVEKGLKEHSFDAWGGPDRGHHHFTLKQQAMAYTMASILTTGGIRGNKKLVGWFQPRSFNMGMSRKVYETTKGFIFTHFAEDIELSIRMKKTGFRVGLIVDAFVYHKRRSTFSQFFRQVFNFGRGRAMLGTVHPEEIKLTHWFPTFFTLGLLLCVVLAFVHHNLFLLSILFLLIYLLAILVHAAITTRSLSVAILSIPSAILQLTGYGLGFLKERLKTYLH